MLSKRVQKLKPSPTLALAAKAKELKAQGNDVISLSVGEPDWDTFPSIKAAGKMAIDEGHTKYTPASGLPELRQAICDQTNADLNTNYEIAEATVSSGGKFILFSALQSVIDPGDEVIIPAPYWVSYPTMVELSEGVPVIATCDKQDDFKLTAQNLEKHITDKTKLLILNSPSNPTGKMYLKEELEALAEVLKKYPNILIISDDIYNRLVFDESGLAPHILHVAPELKDRVLVTNGASKTYSMTGWRLGWALGPKEWIGAMNRYQSQSVSSACTISQKAALQAIRDGQKELEEAMIKLKKRKNYVCEAFKSLPQVELSEPEGAFYIWPDFSAYMGKTWNGKDLKTSSEFAAALLEDQMVAAVPGIEFGLDGYLRVSYALSEERMAEAVERIGAFLGKLS